MVDRQTVIVCWPRHWINAIYSSKLVPIYSSSCLPYCGKPTTVPTVTYLCLLMGLPFLWHLSALVTAQFYLQTWHLLGMETPKITMITMSYCTARAPSQSPTCHLLHALLQSHMHLASMLLRKKWYLLHLMTMKSMMMRISCWRSNPAYPLLCKCFPIMMMLFFKLSELMSLMTHQMHVLCHDDFNDGEPLPMIARKPTVKKPAIGNQDLYWNPKNSTGLIPDVSHSSSRYNQQIGDALVAVPTTTFQHLEDREIPDAPNPPWWRHTCEG